ncbi:MAG: O-antigen ligase family protein, partial [Armatimonadetes bacterium]|nr:O-antigen ligase family protein [Anaerolineae bacterium]
MPIPRSVFTRPLLLTVTLYFLNYGIMFVTATTPLTLMVNFGIMGLLLVWWGIARWRGGWVWHRTPLDAALFLAGGAALLSLLGNMEDARRIGVGIWTLAGYAVLYYVLADVLANRAIAKILVIDGLLLSGVLILWAGSLQLYTAVSNGWRFPGFFGLPRPISLTGNPNFYASVLIMLLACVIGRWVTARRLWMRGLLALYGGIALVHLFLTYSRGGWLGGAALFGVGLWLSLEGVPIMTRFRGLRRSVQALLILVGALAIGLVGTVSVLIIGSLDDPGRTVGLRTYLWEVALTMFSRQPLTGSGVSTYSKALRELISTPPVTPHIHAHNLALHALAEMGILGLVAVLLTLGISLWAGRVNWQALRLPGATRTERGAFIAGAAGMAGMGVHLVLDTTVILAPVGIMTVLLLVVLTSLPQPVPMVWRWRRLGHGLALAVLSGLLLAAGLWNVGLYDQSFMINQQAALTEDYYQAAQALDVLIAADPTNLGYSGQQATFYGLAAHLTGDPEAARLGAAAAQRALVADPSGAVGWANLGALLWQSGDREAGVAAFAEAARRAPLSWQLALAWAQHAEQVGDADAARSAYSQVFTLFPDAVLLPSVAASPSAADLSPDVPLTDLALVVRLYLDGDPAAAAAQ